MKRYALPPPQPPEISLGKIPGGFRGTAKTLAHMRALIRQGVKDFYVRQKAIDILLDSRIRPKDYLGEIKALFEWVQREVRYTKDPFRLEVLHSPRRLLELRAGDCDDMSILLGAMLEAVGHPVRLVIVGPDPTRPALFTHVYLEVFHRGRWIALDATMPHGMGWAPPSFVKKVIPVARRTTMIAQDMDLQGLGATATPEWLRGLIRSIRREAIKPKDERVRQLWNLMRQRQVLGRSQWTRNFLQRIWSRGLAARQRPYTTRRLVRSLRRWGILPPRPARPTPAGLQPIQPVTTQRLWPVTARRLPVRRVAPVRR